MTKRKVADERTQKSGTMTAKGFVPHLWIDDLGIFAPVKLDFNAPTVGGYMEPMTLPSGATMYALPNGGVQITPSLRL